jgi:hypothetical protein
MVFHMSLCGECYETVRWIVCTPLSVKVFVTLGKQLSSSFANTLQYQWNSHGTVNIPVKTRCVLLHYSNSKHWTCPLNKFHITFQSCIALFKIPCTFLFSVCYEHLRNKQMFRIPHCLDNRLIDGGKVVSPTHWPRSTPEKHYFSASGAHFC